MFAEPKLPLAGEVRKIADPALNAPAASPPWWLEVSMATFLLWLILLFFCWPLAILVLVLYPLIWLLLLPFRILGFAVEGVLQFAKGLFLLPGRLLGAAR